MRPVHAWTAMSLALALSGACGGKVVLDRSSGRGGAGGNGAASGTVTQVCGTTAGSSCPASDWKALDGERAS